MTACTQQQHGPCPQTHARAFSTRSCLRLRSTTASVSAPGLMPCTPASLCGCRSSSLSFACRREHGHMLSSVRTPARYMAICRGATSPMLRLSSNTTSPANPSGVRKIWAQPSQLRQPHHVSVLRCSWRMRAVKRPHAHTSVAHQACQPKSEQRAGCGPHLDSA